MSILIKGMEMPKSCSECPLIEYDEETGCYCYLINQYASRTRPDDCPFIEVPTPHGRLIDADALIAFAYVRQKQTGIACCVDALDISLAPTIIPGKEGE